MGDKVVVTYCLCDDLFKATRSPGGSPEHDDPLFHPCPSRAEGNKLTYDRCQSYSRKLWMVS
jgi:hypothetical protein